MVFGGAIGINCSMPCCHTKLPMPNCPFLKATTPHDFIAVSAPVIKTGLQPLHKLAMAITTRAATWTRFLATLSDTYDLLFIGPPQPVRAPPENIHLLAA